MDEPLEINGEPPAIARAVLEELRCQQYWYRGELAEEANVTFLQCNGVWHRLYFDCGIIFWREDVEAPTSFEAPEIEASYPIVDIGRQLLLTGQVLERYEMTTIPGGSQVEFLFANGRRFIVRNVDDRTTLAG